VNLDLIEQVQGWFSGKVLIRLKNDQRSEMVVARNRAKFLKEKLGM